MDDLVKRLRDGNAAGRDKCKNMTDHFPCSEDCPCALELRVLADSERIEALEARVAAAEKALSQASASLDGIDATGPQEFYLALSAYQATKEGD